MSSITKLHRLLRLTVPSSSLYVETAVSKFQEWFPIVFLDTIRCKSVTYASYPKVRTRALEILDGSKV